MKEKPVFEEVSKQLVCQPNFWVKWLIGGALSFVPIANIFAFGYLYRFSAQLRRTGKLRLPEWHDWKGLFSDGLKFGVIWLAYWVLPLALAFVLSTLFSSLGLFALAYLLIAAAFFVASVLFCSALYRFHMKPEYKVLLEISHIVRMGHVSVAIYVLPIFVFAGIFIFLLPLYGIAFFTGFLMLITQSGSCYRSLELNK